MSRPERPEDDEESTRASRSGTSPLPDPAPPSLPPLIASPREKNKDPLVRGMALGRYTVLERLGAGGMGVVYAAYDPKLDRKVALKLLTEDASQRSETGQTRLLREAQAMASLSHPNVVAVHDVGTFGEGVFVAMEFIAGQDFKRWLLEKPRTWREVLGALIPAGRGLAAAHEAGLVHRDVKPANIMVGADGRVRVMDFGLVRLAGVRELPADPELQSGNSSLEETLTAAGAVMGTPAYMSPEQLRGDPVDARTDQFAFCVTLFRALYGEFPFDKAAQKRLTSGENVRPLEPPASVSRQVPAWIRRIVLRGLSVRPEDRYPSMDALLSELSRDPGRGRRRALAIAAATLAVTAIAGSYPFLRYQRAQICAGMERRLDGVWDGARKKAVEGAFGATDRPYAADAWRRIQPALDAYAQQWARARTEACEATLVQREASDEALAIRSACLDRRLGELETLTSLFASADGHTVDKAMVLVDALTPIQDCRGGTRANAPASSAPGARARLEPLRIKLAQAKLLLQAAQYPRVTAILDEVLPEARRLGAGPVLARALELRGQLDFETGRADAARSELYDAEWVAEGAGESEAAAEISSDLIPVAYKQSQFETAHVWADHARALIRALGGNDALESGVDHREAAVFRAEGRLDRAREAAERAYALRIKRFGPENASVGQSLLLLAGISAASGDDERALDETSRAAALYEKSLGAEHPDTTTARGLEGSFLTSLGRCTEAIGILEAALKAREKNSPGNPFLGMSHWDLGNLYRKMGMPSTAHAHYDRALTLLKKDFGPDHRYVGSLMSDIGRLALQEGRAQDALALARNSLAILIKSPSPDSAGPVAPLALMGRASAALGRWAEADQDEARAVELGEKILVAGDPRLAEPLTVEGEAELGLGRSGDAVKVLERAIGLRGHRAVDPAADARTRFALGRALWAEGRRTEGHRMVVAAADLAGRACNPDVAGAKPISEWLKGHPEEVAANPAP